MRSSSNSIWFREKWLDLPRWIGIETSFPSWTSSKSIYHCFIVFTLIRMMDDRLPYGQIDYVNRMSCCLPNNIHNPQQNHHNVLTPPNMNDKHTFWLFCAFSATAYSFLTFSYFVSLTHTNTYKYQNDNGNEILDLVEKICSASFIDIDQQHWLKQKPHENIKCISEWFCAYFWNNDLWKMISMLQWWFHHTRYGRPFGRLFFAGCNERCQPVWIKTRLTIVTRGQFMPLQKWEEREERSDRYYRHCKLSIHLSTRQILLINVQIEFMHLILRPSQAHKHTKIIYTQAWTPKTKARNEVYEVLPLVHVHFSKAMQASKTFGLGLSLFQFRTKQTNERTNVHTVRVHPLIEHTAFVREECVK